MQLENSMATIPRKSTIGFKYQSVEHGGIHYVEGPSIENLVRCDDKRDADMIAGALNFSTNYDAIKREVQKMILHAEMLQDFK